MTRPDGRSTGSGLLLAALAVGLAAAGTAWAGKTEAAGETAAQASPVAETIANTWGPADPERLDALLEVREAIQPIFERYQTGIVQWSLREAGTQPLYGQALLGVLRLRNTLREELEQRGMTFDAYTRLTLLVYGRWLRAVRDEVPPERTVARALQELAIGIERHLENDPPSSPAKLEKLEERLKAVRFHLAHVRHFAYSDEDKRIVLEKIAPDTKAWLEENRERIEAVDFGVFDTAPPPRPQERGDERAQSS